MNPTKDKLLIVDDEIMFLKLMERIFQTHFDVRICTGGPEALELIKSGFYPGVIVSDQRMPDMTGSEFLSKSMDYSPDSVKIILTGFSEPKDIIPCINEAHAYMFLKKPSSELELIQAVRISFDHFRDIRANKNSSEKLNESVAELNLVKKELYNTISQIIHGMTGFSNEYDCYFYTKHTSYVAKIAKTIAETMNLDKQKIVHITFAALLHQTTYIGMPKIMFLHDPYEIEDSKRTHFFELFFNNISHLKRISILEPITEIVAQLWNHHDGSGHNNPYTGNRFTQEAQIVALANIYHNKVYKVLPEDIEKFQTKGIAIQSANETLSRHAEAVKYFLKKSVWFDMDISTVLHNLIKKKMCPELIPIASELRTTIPFMNVRLDQKTVAKEIKPVEVIKPIQEVPPDLEDTFILNINSDSIVFEKDLSSSALKSGMVTNQNVVTREGKMVVRNNVTLDENLIKQIKTLDDSGLLFGSISVKITSEV
ncbi:MAG: response regulator [Candidatus Kapabacteria bacterium]|nr:response regulator [Candidatus Kapabacteria bacterium]